MGNSPLPCGISLADLTEAAQAWLDDCELGNLSPQTISGRRFVTGKLIWFLREHGHTECGTAELRAFFLYVSRPAPGGGRWGFDHPNGKRTVRPWTARTYWNRLRTFFAWCAAEDYLEVSPMGKVRAPIARDDQIQPFTGEQIGELLKAVAMTRYACRNEAIVWLLLDTGCRVSELCGLGVDDVDRPQRCCRVLGKGGKERTIHFGRETARRLWNYLKTRGELRDGEPLFRSERGGRLRREAVRKMIAELGREARIVATRCSPHTFRHYYGVTFLENGGQEFALQETLGHTSLAQTRRYAKLASAHLSEQQRRFSPGDHLKRRKAG